ncbi:MAG: hypothetical protein P3W93_003865 [Thermus sp.]|nr:hypothetical protein [Thermus sp.]
MDLLTLVGSDPGAAAWGAKVVKARFPDEVQGVLLLGSRSWRPEVERSLRALEAWLEGLGFWARRISWEELHQLLEERRDLVVNLTAGTKGEFFHLYRLVQEGGHRAFILEAHSPLPLLGWVNGPVELLPQEELLTFADYQALYLEPAEAKVLGPAAPPRGLEGASWYQVEREGQRVLYAIHLGRPHVFLEPPSGVAFKDHLNSLGRLAKDLGGQVARAFTTPPPGRPQNENDRNTLLRQAQEARVEVLLDDIPLRKVQDPPALPDSGPVLLGLLGEQPVPLLASYLVHRPRWVYLLTTQELQAKQGSLEAYAKVLGPKGARVVAAVITGPAAREEVAAFFGPVVRESLARGYPLVANLNGGTKLMLEGLLQVLPLAQVHGEYLEGTRLVNLSGGHTTDVPWVEVEIQDVLRLFGYNLEPGKAWSKARIFKPRCRSTLQLKAATLLDVADGRQRGKLKSLKEAFLDEWERCSGIRPKSVDDGKALGLAQEYLVITRLEEFLAGKGGKVAPPGHLTPIPSVHNPREVDGVFWLKGSLGFVESKPVLSRALRGDREHNALWVLKEKFGGLFGKGILVVRKLRSDPQQEDPPSLKDVLQETNLRVFSLEGRTQYPWGTIWAFPADLEDAFKSWL